MSPKQRYDDEWNLTEPTLADMGLAKMLATAESAKDKEQPFGQIGLRNAPPIFHGMLVVIAGEYHVSYSRLARDALALGVATLQAEPRIKALKAQLRKLRKQALDDGDEDAMARLDQSPRYLFSRTIPARTTLSIVTWVRGQLSELADACGMDLAQMAVVAIFLALWTLANERGYRDNIRREIDAFWKGMERRSEYLDIASP